MQADVLRMHFEICAHVQIMLRFSLLEVAHTFVIRVLACISTHQLHGNVMVFAGAHTERAGKSKAVRAHCMQCSHLHDHDL